MIKSFFAVAALAAASVADASTTVAVIEVGKGGVVHRTTTERYLSSVSGVASFWGAFHGRQLQYAGMTMVPDLFNKASSGLVVGLTGSGMDLASMPIVAELVKEEGANNVVGHLELQGTQGLNLLKKASNEDIINVMDLKDIKTAESGIRSYNVDVDEDNAGKIDSQISSLIKSLDKEATAAGSTIVFHIVVEEETGAARRRLLSRRLDENQDDEEEQDEDENNNEVNNGNDCSYGYKDSYGNWVPPCKTIFQIQYFNVVLWTAVGLFVVLMFAVYLMIYMPLMADTLLFGESAKMMGE